MGGHSGRTGLKLKKTFATQGGCSMTSMICRRLLPVAMSILAVGAFTLSPTAAQQTYPSQPIKIIVAFPAGGFADGVARIVGDKLQDKLRQTVIIENKAGASGNLGARTVAESSPDGHTILLTTTAAAINGTLYKNLGYAPESLRPVSIVGSAPESIVVHPSNPANNLKEFLEQARTKNLDYGTAGIGTGSYIATTYLFKALAKVELVHVPFQGGAAAINAVVGNHVSSVALTVSPLVPHILSGKIRALGLASAKRSTIMPSVPTYAESGFPDFQAASWVGLFVPTKTSDSVVATLNRAIDEILKEPDVQQRMMHFGLDPMSGNTEETTAFFNREVANWGKMVRTLGLSIN
jgi:tripartite-type tricarboxylate transporter receptor subunit TctC